MSKAKTKLTTVNVIENTYKQFRIKTIETDGLNFQKLVNRSVHQYIHDNVIQEQIETYDKLHISGSQF